MKFRFFYAIALLFFSLTVFAVDKKIKVVEEKSAFFPEFVTSFPVFAGAGGGFSFNDRFQAALTFGFVPQAYYSVIGQLAAQYGGNSSYKDVIEAGFQNNSMVRFSGTYNLENRLQGWHFIFSGAALTSSGSAQIDQVLAASTGKDYTNLKTLLIAAGRSTKVDMNATLQIVELQAAYSWLIAENYAVDVTFGVAKVIGSDVHLKTGLTAFENTNAGNNLIRSSESDIESIIEQYGVSPTVGISARYFF